MNYDNSWRFCSISPWHQAEFGGTYANGPYASRNSCKLNLDREWTKRDKLGIKKMEGANG